MSKVNIHNATLGRKAIDYTKIRAVPVTTGNGTRRCPQCANLIFVSPVLHGGSTSYHLGEFRMEAPYKIAWMEDCRCG